MTIRVLPPEVAARIAAGEVIERPASVVKELVENSLDSGASRISVEAKGGGIELIRITDDGCGISPDDLPTAFERHATSKLASDDDLFRVLTLGFRGEALPSVAAVAEVELVSRPPASDSAGAIRLVPGAPVEIGVQGAPEGTTATVQRIFERQPARRKFLRSAQSESNAIAAVVTHYALAHPHVRFTLTIDGRESLHTDGSGDLRDAVAAVYGAETASAMIEVHPLEDRDVAVEGLIAPPHISRSNRSYISLFLNGRWIQNRRLAFAVEEAYAGMLMVGRHPIAVLNLRLPPEDVDVNVHPTKAEVRLRDESAVFSAVQRSVRAALATSAPVPQAQPFRELSLAGQPPPPLWQHAVSVESRPSTAVAPQPDEPAKSTPATTLPVLRVIGQFAGVYIIAEGPEGMFLIDQHAAHERVLYERFFEMRQALREHGFDFEEFGDGTFIVRALPVSISGPDVRESLTALLDKMLDEGEGDRRDRVAMSLACHGAIRAGKTLSQDEMRELIRQLEETATPNTCPHGRPTMVHMSADFLAREFGRR
jgi:DNA mismatch repair protein MutL